MTCNKCNVQYVGESGDPRTRLGKYLRAAWHPLPENATGIERHLADGLHSPSDLSFTFVDGLPQRVFHRTCLVRAIRYRLENIWIHRLGATLNVRRRLPSSFLTQPPKRRRA